MTDAAPQIRPPGQDAANTWVQSLLAYAAATVLCIAALICVMQLWNADLHLPFGYINSELPGSGGDSFAVYIEVKGIIDNGWILTNPYLGAPTGLFMHDYPVPDNLHLFILKFLTLFSHDFGVVDNLYYLLTFPLATLTSLAVMRRLRLSNFPAILCSVLFAFLPYHFTRGESHLFLAAYFLIPPAVLLMIYLMNGSFDNPTHLRRRIILSLILCVFIGSAGAYYAFFAGFLFVVAALVNTFQNRTIRPVILAMVFGAVMAGTILVNVLPHLLFVAQHGANSHIANRMPIDAEIFGLKIAPLLLPVQGHRIPALEAINYKYGSTAPLVNENEGGPLGFVGGFGFIFLLFVLLMKPNDQQQQGLARKLALLMVFAILLGTIGGLGSLFNYLVTPFIRCYNRISVYIAFFALCSVALLFDRLWRAWYFPKEKRLAAALILSVILCAGLFDQTSDQYVPLYDKIRTDYASDDQFVKQIESTMPDGAMIFQLPYVPFPEQPPINAMGDYQLFRGYLHSRHLRWSYGAMQGRDADRIQSIIAASATAVDLIKAMTDHGFSGIYLDRFAYTDRTIEDQLTLAAGPPLVSANKRLVFFNLNRPAPNPPR